jgi:SPW repeat
VVNFVLGTWLFISPWILGFSDAGVIATSAWLFGIIIAGLALAAIFAYESWEEWVAAAIGVWVFISPWVLGAASDARILELADRRGAARDPGALVVLTRARFGSRHVATLTHSRVAATLRRVCRRASAWP